MITTTVTCDVCGVAKKETNRWFIVAASANPPYLAINHAENRHTIPKALQAEDVCGEQCAVRLVQCWMATGSFPRSEAVKEKP